MGTHLKKQSNKSTIITTQWHYEEWLHVRNNYVNPISQSCAKCLHHELEPLDVLYNHRVR